MVQILLTSLALASSALDNEGLVMLQSMPIGEGHAVPGAFDLQDVLAGNVPVKTPRSGGSGWQSALHNVLEQVNHVGDTCNCKLGGTEEYKMCQAAIDNADSAWSFGIKGYDPWGHYLNKNFGMVPNTFDCYDPRKPVDFESNFAAVCLSLDGPGIVEKDNLLGMQAHGQSRINFTNLPEVLAGIGAGKSLVKMDIEGSEWDVLEDVSPSVLKTIGSFNVEYHFGGRQDEFDRLARIVAKMNDNFAVVGADVTFYNAPWIGYVQVAYAQRSLCKSVKP